MSRTGWVIITISIALNLILGYLLLIKKNEPKPTLTTTEYIERIDSLNSKLDTITEYRYIIRDRIDTVYVELEKVKVVYEKARNTVINNTTDDNLIFFREYLERNRNRRDSINNLY